MMDCHYYLLESEIRRLMRKGIKSDSKAWILITKNKRGITLEVLRSH